MTRDSIANGLLKACIRLQLDWTDSCDDPADVAAEFSEASDSAAVEVVEGTTVNVTSSCWTTGSSSFGVISSSDWPKIHYKLLFISKNS